MFFTKKRKAMLASVLFAAMLLSQFSGLSWGTEKETSVAKAAYETAPMDALPVTGAALVYDASMVLSEVQMTDRTATKITLSWSYTGELSAQYYIYQYDEASDRYAAVVTTTDTTYTFTGLTSATRYYFIVCPYSELQGIQGQCSAIVSAYTKPAKVKELTVSDNKATTLNLAWKECTGAEGYRIYRALGSGSFEEVAQTTEASYSDSGLTAGKTYRYKVKAYAFDLDNVGSASDVVKTSTTPSTPSVTTKGGDQKARISWKALTGASGYYVYRYNGTEYEQVAKLEGKSNTTYIDKKLKNGTSYSYKVIAYRLYQEVEYNSDYSSVSKASVASVAATSVKAKLYKNKKAIKKSDAYKNSATMKKMWSYAKSFVLPGLSHTNVDGFASATMCPQGITFAGSYILLTAYDTSSTENSVIYVLKKSNRKLLTTVVLPNKAHLGGIAYDGTNVWVTQAYTVHSIPFSKIKAAVKSKQASYSIDAFASSCVLTHKAATLTYYKSRLWVASYNELTQGYLGAYTISDKSGSPTLTKQAIMRIPTKVQGIAFTSSGKLLLSRSCQTNSKMRGFEHVLDIYSPNLKKLSSGTITLGKRKKRLDMPTMNEEIAISGNYLYVTYESGAFSSAVQRMDRVCAFNLKKIVK
ncbi:MAG: hypothetical protein LUH14_03915 [Clostridiaceae bacterium]|nr:hypothetical protein [Clostridiaceae bacterium]